MKNLYLKPAGSNRLCCAIGAIFGLFLFATANAQCDDNIGRKLPVGTTCSSTVFNSSRNVNYWDDAPYNGSCGEGLYDDDYRFFDAISYSTRVDYTPDINDAILTIFEGACSVSMTPVACSNLAGNGGLESVTLSTVPGTRYRIRIQRVNSNSTMTGTICVVDADVCTGPISTWNGSAWLPSPPTPDRRAVIEGDYNQSADIIACNLTVNSGVVNVPSGTTFTIMKNVIVSPSASLTFQSNAILLQTPSGMSNSGNITIKRQTAIRRLDYTYWSSPVGGQYLKTFSPMTVSPPVGASRFYKIDESTNSFSVINAPETTLFNKGAGYVIRAPNNQSTSVAPWTGSFTGVPQKGLVVVPLTVTTAQKGFNLVGNPYPSPINADLLLQSINNSATLYFWSHADQNASSGANYASYNSFSGTAATAGGQVPDGVIQVGQGFIIRPSLPVNVSFTDAMRVANTQNQFFRTADVSQTSRIWLNLNANNEALNQIVVGYTAEATLGVDPGMDGLLFGGETFIASMIDNDDYVIQARPSFTVTDVVPIRFKASTDGSYTISIDHVDGVFSEGQPVYLTDYYSGTTQLLSEGAYTFNAVAGTFTDRFALSYQSALGISNPLQENTLVYKEQNGIRIQAASTTIAEVSIFDMSGRLLAQQKNIGDTVASFTNLKSEKQVLLVRITAIDGQIVTRKIVF